MPLFGAGTNIGTGIVFSLYDNFTANATRIQSKFTQLETITTTASAKMTSAMNKMKLGFTSLLVAGAMLIPWYGAINSAIEYESAFAGIRKTVNATEPEFRQISDNILSMSKRMPIAANNLARIGELAGQLGVEGVDNITKFEEVIAKLAITTDLTEEAGAKSFARIANIMQEPISNIDRMGSTIVALGNNFATTESEITEFTNRIAGAGKIAQLTTSDIFGISTAFSSVGVQAERGGTAVSKTLFSMADAVSGTGKNLEQFAFVAGMTVDEFSKLFKTDAIKAFDYFIKGLGSRGIQATNLLDELELSDQRLLQSFISVANAGDLMSRSIQMSGKAWQENIALNKEAQQRFNTTASQIDIMRNNFRSLGITLGQTKLTFVKALATISTFFANLFERIAKNPLGKFMLNVTFAGGLLLGVLGLLIVAMGAAKFMAAKAAIAFAAMGKAQLAATFANKGLIAGLRALTVASFKALIAFWPWLLVGAVVGGAIYLIVKSVRAFDDVLKGNAEKATGWLGILQKIGGAIRGFIHIWRSATTEGFTLSQQMHDALERIGILNFVIQLGTWIVRIKALFSGLYVGLMWWVSGIRAVWNVIKTGINWIGKELDKLGIGFLKNTSQVQNWVEWGKILGVVLGGVLLIAIMGITVALWNMAAAVIAATWPVLLIITVIGAVIAVIYYWGDIVDWIGEKWDQFVNWTIRKLIEFGGWLVGLKDKFLDWGSGIIESIKTGITNAWGKFKEWFWSLIEGLVEPVADVLEWLGLIDGSEVNVNQNVDGKTEPTGLGKKIGEQKAQQYSGPTNTVTSNSKVETLRDVQFVMPDGRVLAAVVNDQNSLDNFRENGG